MNRRRLLGILATILIGFSGQRALGQSVQIFESPVKQVNLLELYTSEGCSSCPPAEAWLDSLRGRKLLWKSFVPLEFHVEYWDSPSWKDRFANPLYSQRQHQYVGRWKQSPPYTVYTPNFVLNGADWHMRGNNNAIEKLGVERGQLTITRNATNYALVFNPSGVSDTSLLAHAVLLGNGIKSHIRGGENAGRKLSHEFVVLQWQQKALKPIESRLTANFELDTSPYLKEATSFSVGFWVSSMNHPEPLQAAGGDLRVSK